MKILHLMLACFYIDNYSYQENLLPKYHAKAGNQVEIIASLFTFDENGNGKWLTEPSKYENEYGIPVTRLSFKKSKFSKTLRKYQGLYSELERVSPDILFIHGVQFADIAVIVKYLKKHKDVKVYVDNHADFSNSAKGFISKNIQHKMLWRYYAKKIEPFVTKFYGVLPARVDFLKNVYKLPENKIELLVMGADDEAVEKADNPKIKADIRKKYNIPEDDFLIIYGGKTDNYKKQVFLLMDAVNNIDDSKVKLIIFGSIIPELKEEIEKRCSDKVQYIGWVLAANSYNYFAASDLAVFPGRHSVFWEQVAGQGIPMLVKKWDGTTHVDCGGNIEFLTQDSAIEIENAIKEIMANEKYVAMKKSAKDAAHIFMYSDIADRSINKN